jgi:hypothetical protein
VGPRHALARPLGVLGPLRLTLVEDGEIIAGLDVDTVALQKFFRQNLGRGPKCGRPTGFIQLGDNKP